MKNIKELYDKYMSVTQATDTPLEVVLDISSTFWDDLHHDGVSLSIKQQIARNWQLKNCCNKEKDLLKDDMLNFLYFIQNKTNIIRLAFEHSVLSPGVHSLAQKKLACLDHLLSRGILTFSNLISIPEDIVHSVIPHTQCYSSSSSDSSDSESDLDDDFDSII